MSVTLQGTPPAAGSVNWVPVGGNPGISSGIGARVWRSTAQSIPNNVWTALIFDSVRWDSSGHWAAANPTRLTCKVAGTYVITGHVIWQNTGGGANRGMTIRYNGTEVASGGMVGAAIAGGYVPITITTTLALNIGDYVELFLNQDQGAALATLSGTSWSFSDFSMVLSGGTQGAPGVGVPPGGTTGQILTKLSSSDFNTYWAGKVSNQYGTLAARPSASAVIIQSIYYATDTGQVFISDGVSTWTQISPASLQTYAQAPSGNDCNNAIASGWYWVNGAAANRPGYGSGWEMLTIAQANNNLKQIAYQYDGTFTWTRHMPGNGVWTGWRLESPITGYVNLDGTIYSGTHFSVTHPSTGNYSITLPFALSVPMVNVTPNAQSVVCGCGLVSGSQFNVMMTTPTAWVDSGFAFTVVDTH